MKTPIFTGSAVALITPFTETGVDYEGLGRLIDWQIQEGTDAIVSCGTTGESSTMSHEEHIEVVRYTVQRTAGRVPVIAGTGSNSTAEALSLSQEAEKAGADALLLVTPYYNKATQTGLVQHYLYLADRVNSPIILYNVPSRTGLSFTAASYKALSAHPNINGIKEASGNVTLVAQTRALCGDDLNIWSGNDGDIIPLMSLGTQGVISVLANVAPRETAEMCRMWFDGRIRESGDRQIRYQELVDALFCEVNPIPVKTAVNLMGLPGGLLRMPLCQMEAKNLAFLQTAMRNAGIALA